MTKAGKYRGIDPDGVLETEADHFHEVSWLQAVVRHARARPGAGERSRRRD